jgi:ABC-type transport system involved in cytochrome bd biosynthesis fused ATPase/permease subunit
MIIMILFGGQVRKATIERIVVSKKLGGILEESLSAIKLIVSFAQEDKEIKKVEAAAEKTKKVG